MFPSTRESLVHHILVNLPQRCRNLLPEEYYRRQLVTWPAESSPILEWEVDELGIGPTKNMRYHRKVDHLRTTLYELDAECLKEAEACAQNPSRVRHGYAEAWIQNVLHLRRRELAAPQQESLLIEVFFPVADDPQEWSFWIEIKMQAWTPKQVKPKSTIFHPWATLLNPLTEPLMNYTFNWVYPYSGIPHGRKFVRWIKFQPGELKYIHAIRIARLVARPDAEFESEIGLGMSQLYPRLVVACLLAATNPNGRTIVDGEYYRKPPGLFNLRRWFEGPPLLQLTACEEDRLAQDIWVTKIKPGLDILHARHTAPFQEARKLREEFLNIAKGALESRIRTANIWANLRELSLLAGGPDDPDFIEKDEQLERALEAVNDITVRYFSLQGDLAKFERLVAQLQLEPQA